tara:strand:- start:3191 stop:3517 length:327 start_codon:yes stop_codon:yes gene_type:complete
MNDIWVEITTEDSCMWQLKGNIYAEKPTLEMLQETVGGYIEFVPDSYLAKDVIHMIVNEEGLLRELSVNSLASQQLNMTANNPIFGNAIIHVDEKFITKKYWLSEGEE